MIVAESPGIVVSSPKIVVGSSRIVAGSWRIFKDDWWGSSRFPHKILTEIFRHLKILLRFPPGYAIHLMFCMGFLSRLMQSHILLQQMGKNTLQADREKAFECGQCGKCFSRAANLRQHKRTHTLERSLLNVTSVGNVLVKQAL